ncbi:hypothetical protein H0G86_011490 [Trichoderma simmonsii]|uniref:B30.2/SPRY domain-containing protein n=1 Tax=Trichoderma simmonsii TaxID=1491479 RepID=A0A8G0LLM6_9HYPO|nr:hypothetical protein H0G86_011490 [Trichoderma simmonsii]
MDTALVSDYVRRRQESKFLIYFVGFENVTNNLETNSVVETVKNLIPEAYILRHNIFLRNTSVCFQELHEIKAENSFPNDAKGFTDTSSHGCCWGIAPETKAKIHQESATSINEVEPEIFSQEWIHHQALALLKCIQEHNTQKRVLLAAYGFGGLIVKQALIIANTEPCYYTAAINIDSLFFVSVPDQATETDVLERQMFDSVNKTKRQYRGRLSQILQDLVNFATQVTYDFCRFAGKYRITRWIEEGNNDTPVTVEVDKVLPLPKKSGEGVLDPSIENLKQLELLRSSFAPRHLLAFSSSNNFHLSGNDFTKAYFDALRSLSQSTWTLSEAQTLNNPEDFKSLHETHRSALAQFSFDQIIGSSIQVIGPQGSGKSTFVKFLYQKIIQGSSVVSINSIIHPKQINQNPCTLYMDCIRQIFSQKPELFSPVQGLYSEIVNHNIWSEEALKLLFASILHHSRNTNFLIIIHNFDACPQNIQSLWLEVKGLFTGAMSSSCTFLTSSRNQIKDFSVSSEALFDLNTKHKDSVAALIMTRTRQLIKYDRILLSSNKTVHSTIETNCLSSPELLNIPMSILTPYLTLLFQRHTLNSLNCIKKEVTNLEATSCGIFAENIRVLKTKSPSIQSWASATLSWVLQVHRPLRLEELSAAMAIDALDSNVEQLQENISMAIADDLRNHLAGFITVEQKYVYLINTDARGYLLDEGMKHQEIPCLHTEEELVKIALHYITMVLESEYRDSTGVCIPGSLHRHEHETSNPILEFMDYACRFWHMHFLRIDTPSVAINDRVVRFLNNRQVVNRWFELYLRSNGLRSYLLGEDAIMTSAVRRAEDEDNRVLDYSPLQIACYFGLTSLLSILSEVDHSQGLHTLRIRHGHSEHDMVILQSQTVHYLSTASLASDNQFVQPILKADTGVMSKYFPLHRAAILGLSEAFKLLFDKRSDFPKSDKDSRSPLHMAAICGSLEIISFIINEAKETKNMVLNSLDKNRETALIIATRLGNFEAARLLVESGTDIAVQNTSGRSAVHYAVLNCPQILELLLQKNNDVLFLTDTSNCTALHFAAKIGSTESISIITGAVPKHEQLLDLLEAADGDGKTALQHAAENGYDQIAMNLIKLTGSQKNDTMACIYAAKRGHLSTLRIMRATMRDGLQLESELLASASGAGQLLIVHYLLQNGISALRSGEGDHPAICAAASNGFVEIVRTLLRNGADINAKDINRQTPLHHATKNEMFHVANTLLNPRTWASNTQEPANVNAVDSSRYTPLHFAAMSGNIRITELLVRSKPDLSARSRQGETPLHLATKSPEIVKILLNHGAKVNAVDISEQTPLHITSKTGCVEAARKLIENGADTEAVDINGKTPLYYAIENQHIPIIEAILYYQNNFLRVWNDPWLNLELAVTQSKLEVLKYLVKQVPDAANLTDRRKRTLLHVAASYDSHEIVSYLADLALDVNQIDLETKTPLHLAAEKGLVNNIKALIKKEDIQIDKTDDNDDTPLHLAVDGDHLKAVCLLLDAGSAIDRKGRRERSPLFKAAYFGKVDIAKELLARGADPELPGERGWRPLHGGADNMDIVQLLITRGVDINAQKLDLWTPLHLSIFWGKRDIVQFLLTSGADPNIPNEDGNTPFHLSFASGMEDIFIRHQGPICIDLDKYDADGYAPIHKAILESSPEILKVLIRKGANLQAKTKTKFMSSCLTIAVDEGRADNFSVLLDHEEPVCNNPPWDDDEISSIYWLAISKSDVASVKVLIHHRFGLPQEIFQELPNEENRLSQLEAFLEKSSLRYEMQSFVKGMMDFGFNPFQRSSLSKRSAFELHITSPRGANEHFLLACIGNLDETRFSKLGFQELRAAWELDCLSLCKGLQKIRENISKEETDQDGWTIDHFLHRSHPRINLDEWEDISPESPTKLPDALILPASWRLPGTDYATRVSIASNALEVSFKYGSAPIALRSNFPSSSRMSGLVYFEVTIQAQSSDAIPEEVADNAHNPNSCIISAGFCGEFCNLSQSHVGWEKWSVGYHGDDGYIFHESAESSPGTGFTFGPGDTIGCGIDYDSEKYFFTHNGVVIYSQRSTIIYRKVYPAVAHRYIPCQIEVNFGSSNFRWKGANSTE